MKMELAYVKMLFASCLINRAVKWVGLKRAALNK